MKDDTRNNQADLELATPRERRKLYSALDTHRGSTWWAPGAIGWWVGVLFAFGATLFALGSAPGYSKAVGNYADGLTFFIGSVFFTSAAVLQYLEAANTLSDSEAGGRLHVFSWKPTDLAWAAALVQLAGTLYFNASTFWATHANLSTPGADHLVWKPDLFGSVCFLIAATLAWFEFTRSVWEWRPRSLSWWIVALNLLGSLAFGVSAVAAYIIPTTGNDFNKALVNLGTFVGAICFFVAALMLLPERTKPSLD